MDVSLCRHETPGGRDEIYVGRYSHFARSCFFFFFHLLGLWFWRHDWIWANAAIHKGQLLLCKHAACTMLPTFTCRYTCANGLKRKEIDGNPFLTSLKSLDGAFFCWIMWYMHFFFFYPSRKTYLAKCQKRKTPAAVSLNVLSHTDLGIYLWALSVAAHFRSALTGAWYEDSANHS